MTIMNKTIVEISKDISCAQIWFKKYVTVHRNITDVRFTFKVDRNSNVNQELPSLQFVCDKRYARAYINDASQLSKTFLDYYTGIPKFL